MAAAGAPSPSRPGGLSCAPTAPRAVITAAESLALHHGALAAATPAIQATGPRPARPLPALRSPPTSPASATFSKKQGTPAEKRRKAVRHSRSQRSAQCAAKVRCGAGGAMPGLQRRAGRHRAGNGLGARRTQLTGCELGLGVHLKADAQQGRLR